MDFGLSNEQRALQDTVADFLRDFSSVAAVRRILGGDVESAKALGGGLARLGASAIAVPAEHGGLGLGVLDAALLSEMTGRFVAPVDPMGTTLTAFALRRAGSESRKSAWFEGIMKGELDFGVALAHAISDREGQSVTSDGGRLRGRSLFVTCPPAATHFLVPDDQGALWIIARGSAGLALRPLATIDRTRRFCVLEMEGVEGERLAMARGQDLVDELVAIARVLVAADALGAAQRMVEMAVAYAHERRQFGVPIGSFQAVKHMCAEMAAELEPCRALMWYAAQSLDRQAPDALVTACHAKGRISDVARFVARTATEVHGGIGFTEELGLHLWFKRIGVDRQLWGGPESLRAEAARRQGWAN
jgi:alkylation response protein AidB-like acyl-CoA dehydrogenase